MVLSSEDFDSQGSSDLPPVSSTPVVGIGASAGGLEAIQEFLAGLSETARACAFIVAQHVSPSHKSMLVQLLSKGTTMMVKEAEDQEVIIPSTLYITPPDKDITIKYGLIHLQKPPASVGPKPSVDVFFRSLAQEVSPQQLMVVILSGTGSDGAQGVKQVCDAGGLVLVQNPTTAKYDGMPSSAIQNCPLAEILAPQDMGKAIDQFLKDPDHLLKKHTEELSGQGLQQIFKLLSRRTGTDFSNYKSATILRRLNKRLAQLQINSLDAYVEYVDEHPAELDDMFQMILIGVTHFFRDKEAFEKIREQLDQLIRHKQPKDNIRIWVPGCSTGEEPYSLAILLFELMKERSKHLNVQVFATDIDEVAISVGRRGVYAASSLHDVSQEIIDSYFLRKGDQYELVKSIRSMVLFSKHDVTSNPPFLKLDMISCRNLLIYFGSSLQQQIFPIFHYALNLDGILFLGKSESVGHFGDLFSTSDAKNKIFQRKRGSSLHAVKFATFKPQRLSSSANMPSTIVKQNRPPSISELVKESLFDYLEHPYVVINEQGEIAEINGDVRLYLTLPQGEIQANLMKMINGELQVEARSLLTRCIKEKQLVKGTIKRFQIFDQHYQVRMTAMPLSYQENTPQLYLVLFERINPDELSSRSISRNEDEWVSNRITELERELEATKEHLQAYIEEIETGNEELQSLNEEMQSTNEELQSSNEELETSNEELQSTNEEIQIAYTELKAANEELEKKEKLLHERKFQLEALLNNSLQAFLLIDHKYHIQAFNESANLICGLLHQRVLRKGETLVDFTTTANLEQVISDIKRAFDGERISGIRDEISVYGTVYSFEYSFTPVMDQHNRVQVVSYGLIDITESKRANEKLISTQHLLNAVFNASMNGICIIDNKARIVEVNEAFGRIFGYAHQDLIGSSFSLLVPTDLREHVLLTLEDAYHHQRDTTQDWRMLRRDGGIIDAYVNAQLLDQQPAGIFQVVAVKDLTESKKYRSLLETTQASVQAGGWEFDAISGEWVGTNEFYHILGILPNTPLDVAMIGRLFREESEMGFANAMDQAIRQGEVFDLELELQGDALKSSWVRITCKPVRVYQKTVKLFGTIQEITESKQNQIWLKLIESAITHANDAVLIAEAKSDTFDSLVIRYINHGFEKLSGYGAEELIGNSPQLIFGELSDAGNMARLDKVIETQERYSTDIICYRKDGTRFWNNISLSPVVNVKDNESYWVIIQRDVSEKKAQEKQAELYDAISAIINQGNSLNDTLKQLITFLAQAHEFDYGQVWMPHIDGLNLHVVADWKKNDLLIPPDWQFTERENKVLDRVCQPSLRSKNPTLYLLSEKNDGEETDPNRVCLRNAGFMSSICFPVYSGTELVCVLVFYSTQLNHPLYQITHTLNSLAGKLGPEVKRQKAEEEINRFFDVSPDVLCIAGVDGFFKRVNPSFCHMLGYDKQLLLSRPILSFVHPDDQHITESRLEENVHGKPTVYFENRYLTSTGAIVWFAWTSVTIIDEGLIFAVAKDITSRKESENELSRLNQTLEAKASELEGTNKELEQFAYVASHDLQEPLRMVSSFLGLLEKKYEDKLDEQGKTFIHMAVDGATRMRQIILDLLEFSRVGRLDAQRERINVTLLLQTVTMQSQRIIEEVHAEVTVGDMPEVVANRTLLQQVFQNLLGNAIKYATPGIAPRIEISSKPIDQGWQFSVADNGIGIAPEYREKIFIIFQRLHTHSEHPGSGIGLAICKKIVEFHGGRIWVESNGSRGSTFHFTLPDRPLVDPAT